MQLDAMEERYWERQKEEYTFGDEPRTLAEVVELEPLIKSSSAFIKGFIPPDYLIDGILQRRFIYSLTAPTGGGKTAIALCLSASVGVANSHYLPSRPSDRKGASTLSRWGEPRRYSNALDYHGGRVCVRL
jgi:hypothetical protein